MSRNVRSLPCAFAVCWSVRHSVHCTGRLSLRASRQHATYCGCRQILLPNAPPMSCETKRSLSMPGAQRRRHPDRADAGHLVVAVHRPLARAAVVLDEDAGALERRRREAVEVQPLDLDDVVGLRDRALVVAPVEDALPDDVRARVVVEDRLVLAAPPRAVVSAGSGSYSTSTSSAASRASSRDDATTAATGSPTWRTRSDGERVVLDVGARLHRQLEERVGEDRDLVAGERAVDAAELERLRDVDRQDLRVRVRRADEVHVAHAVALDVVEEDALALDEPLVLLARDVRAGEAGFVSPGATTSGAGHRLCHFVSRLDRLDDVHVAGAAADVALDRLADLAPRSASGLSRSSAVALISIPGVQ